MNDTDISIKRELLDIFAKNGYSFKGSSMQRILHMLLLECMKDKSKASVMADSLIEDLGDIYRILFADIALLCSSGLLREEAENLIMIGAVFSRISSDGYPLPLNINDHKLFESYLRALFRFDFVEKLYAFPVIDGKIVDCCYISEGDERSMKFNFDHILKQLAAYPECSSYILAHNHPNGMSKPSASDISSTKILAAKLKMLGYDLIGHYTVGYDGMDIVLEDMNYVEYLFDRGFNDF